MRATDLKFLVADDFTTMRRIIVGLLRESGFSDTVEADNGQSAFRQVKRVDANYFIISDWNMPIWTGLDFLTAVRADPVLSMTPFLLVTAEAKRENILTAVHAGADGYIVKPFTAVTLKNKLLQILAKRGIEV